MSAHRPLGRTPTPLNLVRDRCLRSIAILPPSVERTT